MEEAKAQKLAKHYLAQRELGYSVAMQIRSGAAYYIFMVAILVGFIVGAVLAQNLFLKGVFLYSVGSFIGALLRDLRWFRATKAIWPFTQMIIDWKLVEKIAKVAGSTAE